jgi:hypothetical protein
LETPFSINSTIFPLTAGCNADDLSGIMEA